MRYVNNIPSFLIKRCSILKNYSIFSLPDINNTHDLKYLWENILSIKLSEFLEIYTIKIYINLIYFDNNKKTTNTERLKIPKSNFIPFITNKLKTNHTLFFYIKNKSYSYGYIIIPGDINCM